MTITITKLKRAALEAKDALPVGEVTLAEHSALEVLAGSPTLLTVLAELLSERAPRWERQDEPVDPIYDADGMRVVV